ncbi:MAG: LysM peptidoglycan-binding domain-containing protein [Verrucomicrobiota bacterium]
MTLLFPTGGFGQQAPATEPAVPAQGIVHTVVAGDTLWDLSAKYLGTPWKWPEIWERNRFVTNPHYIYPGIRIVIVPPPPAEVTMVVEPPAQPPAPAPEAAATSASAAPEQPTAPAASAPRDRFLDIVPSDFVRAGEFVSEAPKGVGRIEGGRDPKVGFVEGDTVYLRLDRQMPAGQLLGVYRVRGPIAVSGGRSHSGYVKYLIGVLQVGPVEDGELTARVRQSFEDLTRADLVSEEIPGYARVKIAPGEEGLSARVIACQTANAEIATGNFVYLDRGASAGVAVGNVFRVLVPTGITAGTPMASRWHVRSEVARVVVVRVNSNFSTAYVDSSTQSFPAGALALRGMPAK